MAKFKVLENIQIFADANSVEISVSESLDDHLHVLIKDYRKDKVRIGVEFDGCVFYMDLEKAMSIIRKSEEPLM
jgi:hypothetical protein